MFGFLAVLLPALGGALIGSLLLPSLATAAVGAGAVASFVVLRRHRKFRQAAGAPANLNPSQR